MELLSQLLRIEISTGSGPPHSIDLVSQFLDATISLGYVGVFALDCQLFSLNLFLECLYLCLEVLHLLFDDIELGLAFGPDFVYLNFGIGLLDFFGLFNTLSEFLFGFGL